MSNTTRMLPSSAAAAAIAVNGRNYTTASSPVDVIIQSDAQVLAANKWISVAPSGSTAQRPTTAQTGNGPVPVGQIYLDTTLAYLIVFDGALWRNPATAASV